MRTDIDVMRDIKTAPFRDIHGEVILPGQFVCVNFSKGGTPICMVAEVKDGEFTIGGIDIDEVLENYNVFVMGWVQ